MNEFYHLRALRYRKSLWNTHTNAVEQFLKSWKAPANLIIVGPSAGYSLPLDWLARFDSITVIEPAWLSRKILASRLLPLNTSTRFISTPLSFESPHIFQGFDLKDSGVLFANVLGQIPVKSEDALRTSLQAALKNVTWASYHDRFSSAEPVWKYPDGEVSRVYATSELIPEAQSKRYRKAPDVQEHLASEALAGLQPQRVRYWDWQITPQQVHLIEGMIFER